MPQNSKPSTKIETPNLSLPKGGGAINGMGESFQANEFTGTCSLSIPIPVSACRGSEPELKLDYSSGTGNALFGLGFQLNTPSISRQTSKGTPRYDDSDTFLFAAQDYLVAKSDVDDATRKARSEHGKVIEFSVRRYVPRVEGSFYIIEHWRPREIDEGDMPDGESFWRVIDDHNTTLVFGKTQKARVADPDQPGRVFQWLLEYVVDRHGNATHYKYEPSSFASGEESAESKPREDRANRYLNRICYGNSVAVSSPVDLQGDTLHGSGNASIDGMSADWHFEVVFDYGQYSLGSNEPLSIDPNAKAKERPDSFSSYGAGFEIRTNLLCRNILMFHRFQELGDSGPVLVRSMSLKYTPSPVVSQLRSIQQTGYRRTSDNSYQTASLPPLEFDYTELSSIETNQFQPLLFETAESSTRAQTSFELVDLYGEGLPGLLYSDRQTTYYREPIFFDANGENGRNDTQARFGPASRSPSLPIDGIQSDSNHMLVDLTGNGMLDWIVSSPEKAGFYQVKADRSWKAFQPFEKFPSDFQNPANEMVDITGDGLSDCVRVGQPATLMYRNDRERGFADPTVVPAAAGLPPSTEAATKELTTFADMAGSGQQHLVRIKSGQVEYWPNLGFGRFGGSVSMENSPNIERFRADRLYLADLDGSGTTDLVYAYRDRVEIFINQSGNSFSDPVSVKLPADFDSLDQISFADVHGTGGSCLIFKQHHPNPKQWYLDLCFNRETQRREKPYLLNKITNNLGAETRLLYRSSTHFYLKDKADNKPWLTNLPFPVQVVERIEHDDLISGSKLVNRYAYHHGYFDAVEREFRGFGQVERWDAERFDERQASQGETSSDAERSQAKSEWVAPSYTKTWYHNGATFESGITSQFASEFYQGGALSTTQNGNALLPDSILVDVADKQIDEPNVAVLRDSNRSLHGQVLRTEIYGDDQNSVSEIPYAVTESNFEIRLLQPKGPNKYAVFHVVPRETINVDYERVADDPRVNKESVLAVDDFGHVTMSCQTFYGRSSGAQKSADTRKPPYATETGVYPEQSTPQAVVTSSQFINLVDIEDVNLLGVPCQERKFELSLPPDSEQLDFDSLAKQANAAIENFVTFGDQLGSASARARLTSWQQHYYADTPQGNGNDGSPLKLGSVTPQYLPHRDHVAVFAQSQIDTVFTEKGVTAELLSDRSGGAYRFDDSSRHWWSVSESASYLGPESFYLPFQWVNSTGSTTSVKHDDNWLIPTEVTDAMNNTTTSEIDYITLSPYRITDSNKNVSEALFDPLGMVVATSLYGTVEGKPTGDFALWNAATSGGSHETAYKVPEQLLDNSAEDQRDIFNEVIANTQKFLQNATSFFYYDLFAWKREQQPPRFISLLREHHLNQPDGDPAAESDQRAAIQVSIGYSDGFGRRLQSKLRASGGPATVMQNGEPVEQQVDVRWLTTGRTVFNNKGSVVKQYEPYFSATPDCEPESAIAECGVTDINYYDPLLRVVRVDSPKGFFSRVEFPNAWVTKHYDYTDTISASPYFKENNGQFGEDKDKQDALDAAIQSADTPRIEIHDNLGRTFLNVEMLTAEGDCKDFLFTHSQLDIVGNEITSTDPRLHKLNDERKTNQYNFTRVFDMLGNVLCQVSADAGERWELKNALGNPFCVWDGRGFHQRLRYDALQRVKQVKVADSDDRGLLLDNVVEFYNYGDEPELDIDDAQSKNLRGRVVDQYDQAGRTRFESYDLQGQLRRSRRQLRIVYDWQSGNIREEANWPVSENTVDNQNLLEDETFDFTSRYDALKRLESESLPDGENGKAGSTISQKYLPEGTLKSVSVAYADGTQADYLKSAIYNARGQSTRLEYGNGVTTTHQYDAKTFNLTSLRSTRENNDTNGGTGVLQHRVYTYDPMNNVTQIEDRAQSTSFYANQQIEPVFKYSYDPLYRLTQASGREHMSLANEPESSGSRNKLSFLPLSNINDSQQLSNYTESYTYDAGGNLVQTKHRGTNDWTRMMIVAGGQPGGEGDGSVASNRAMDSTQLNGSKKIDDFFDANGNLLSLDTHRLRWDYRNEVAAAVTIQRDDGVDDAEYYVYDSSGQRTRRISVHLVANGGIEVEEKLYLAGLEIKRIRQLPAATGNDASPTEAANHPLILERRSVHVFHGENRIAISHDWSIDKFQRETKHLAIGMRQDRYHLDDHLGSVAYELDGSGELISYEEYMPYGGTAFMIGTNQAEVKLKEYRYSGKEKDEVTGLYYYGARYYAPWLNRWLNPDPGGTIDGINLYHFVGNNPIIYKDKTGHCKHSAIAETSKEYHSYLLSHERYTGHKNKVLRVDVESGKDIAKIQATMVQEGGRPSRLELNMDDADKKATFQFFRSGNDKMQKTKKINLKYNAPPKVVAYPGLARELDKISNRADAVRAVRRTMKGSSKGMPASLSKDEQKLAMHLGNLLAYPETLRAEVAFPMGMGILSDIKHEGKTFVEGFGKGEDSLFVGAPSQKKSAKGGAQRLREFMAGGESHQSIERMITRTRKSGETDHDVINRKVFNHYTGARSSDTTSSNTHPYSLRSNKKRKRHN